VAAIAHGALVLEPAQRFQTTAAMLDAMRPLLPQGLAMHEVMLAPMPKEYRTRIEPRLVINATGVPVVTASRGLRSVMPAYSSRPRRTGATLVLGGLSAIALAAGALFVLPHLRAEAPVAATPETASAPTA